MNFNAIKIFIGQQKYLIFLSLVTVLLILRTGIYSDDFASILAQGSSPSFIYSMKPQGASVSLLLTQFTHGIYFYFTRIDSIWVLLSIKIIYMVACLLMIERFFSIFLETKYAALAAFFFIFYPSHDASVYWFCSQYYIICVASFMFSYYMIRKRRYVMAILFAFGGAFIGYSSPPVAFSIAILCLLKKQYKQSLIIIIPAVLYSSYYIVTSYFNSIGLERIPKHISMMSLTKQYILQIMTFVDAVAGPSFGIKIYYSLFEYSFAYLLLLIVSIIGVYCILRIQDKYERGKIDGHLIIALLVLTFATFAIYAITGKYPNIAFNLGNRTTTNGSLLIIYLLFVLPMPKSLFCGIITLLMASIIGISSHWASWTNEQNRIIEAMRINDGLRGLDKELVLISGGQYSKFGPLNHIEFLSEHWVADSILKLAVSKDLRGMSLNHNLRPENDYLLDIKYNVQYPLDKGQIFVYDTETNQLLHLSPDKLNEYIAGLPPNIRHWSQLIENPQITKFILILMPRLKYAFDK